MVLQRSDLVRGAFSSQSQRVNSPFLRITCAPIVKPTIVYGASRGPLFSLLVLALLGTGCQSSNPPLTAEVPLHLEDHLDDATIVGSEVPTDTPEAVEWSFETHQPEWEPITPLMRDVSPVKVSRTDEALRITLTNETDHQSWSGRPRYFGGIFIELPGWNREEWGDILVRARTEEKIEDIGIGFNLRDEVGEEPWERFPFQFYSTKVPVIRDGTVQTYVIPADWSLDYSVQWDGEWRHLGLILGSYEPASIEILSVMVVPKEARYAHAPAGIRTEALDHAFRRTLFTHTPASIEFTVKIPDSGRLDVGLGILRSDSPVTFRVAAGNDSGEIETLLEETCSEKQNWAQRSVDLAHLAGETVNLRLETEAARDGTIGLWAAPTLSGVRQSRQPNVIFYIIDGAGADYMSVYDYNRRTTPFLERLAEEGALFEYAYSNASWTRPSTLSFLTSLQHSALGGMRNNRNAPPGQIETISEQLHQVGYQTALFTSNPNAATLSQLDRGVDVLREKSVEPTSESTRELHSDFWKWRHDYPGEPYWVHFQTTDVHWPHNPPVPFSGLYVSPERRKDLDEWEQKLKAEGIRIDPWADSFERAGISRVAYFKGKGDLYAEAMAHQDYQLGQLVKRLKDTGEWENTLLIIASDHGASAGAWEYGIAVRDPLPPMWGPIFQTDVSRIPLLFVWPGHIPPGKRFRDPVSMVDMVPTILDLLDLPQPDYSHGHSLAPLLLGQAGWEPRPVIFDEFYENSNTGKLRGSIEVIDGRWGASLEINQDPDNDDRPPETRRPVPLLLYDLWEDPYCLNSLHEERPDLVETYTTFLEEQFEAHRALAERFTRNEDSPLNPEQLRTLRALGYIR